MPPAELKSQLSTAHAETSFDAAVVPATAGDGEKIVLFSPVSAHFSEGYTETLSTDPGRFRQNFQQIAFAERTATKAGNGRLLAKQPFHLCGDGHIGAAGMNRLRTKLRGTGPNRRHRKPAHRISSGAHLLRFESSSPLDPWIQLT